MKHTFHTCDVFTDVRFGGNPLAVVLGADDLTSQQMQNVAREFNLSETIFVQAPQDKANSARVRIFLPKGELPFAGHPTIGCSCLLAWLSQKGEDDFETDIKLEENAGLVPVNVKAENGNLFGQLVAPGTPKIFKRTTDHSLIAAGLSLNTDDIGFDGHAAQAIESNGSIILFVPVKNLAAQSTIKISNSALEEAQTKAGARSTVVYTRGGMQEGAEFSMRNFSLSEGIPEDPATGSAAAMFPEQIVEFENLGEGTHTWCVEQGVDMGRPSKLFLEADRQDNHFTQIRVGGGTVFVSSGEIEI